MLQAVQKSPAGAWAMSFFIGGFTPFLGSGQYYAGSYGSAVVTSIIGVVSYGCFMSGVLPEKNPSEGRIKEKKKLQIAGAVIFSVTWLFDWIYAPVATIKYNEKMKKKYMSSAVSIKPLLSYASYVDNKSANTDHIIRMGLSMRF